MEETAVYATGTPPVTLPVLPCPVCGVIETPVLGPGSGPHVAALRCQAGHFIKWAPRVLVDPVRRKELRGMGSVNKVIVVGIIGKFGVTVKYATSGTPCAAFTLVLTDQGQDGKLHATYVDCEVWGKKAEAVGELESGQLALFEGKLAKRRKGEQWELIIAGFDVTPITASALVQEPA
jgi:hypothetical protein